MDPRTDPRLERTPALERLLAETRAALVRQILAYGIGTVLGASTLWLVFAFLADWGLRVPHAIRILHGLALFAVVAVFLWRDLLRPLQALPGRAGLALLFERVHPELKELLISAVQFQRPGAPPAGEPRLVEAVVAEAEARARALDPRAVVDPEAPRARLLLGLGGVLCLIGFAFVNPLLARTFAERLLGGSTAWPQRTNLVLEIPGLDPETVVEKSPERLRLRLARGSDVAVLVTAEGLAPEELTLHFVGGRDLVLNPTGGNVFRTMIQSCQEDLAFFVTGGDDEDGLPRVEIEVLEPPDLEGLALTVEPPAYSGLPPTTVYSQDIEVLKGSRVRVRVLPTPRSATGSVRFLPDDVLQPLVAAAYPLPAAGDDAPSEVPGLGFECLVEKPIGYRIELVDENGLSNPEPGLFRIRVSEDRPPELSVLAPTRGEFETVRGGALPLRVRAEDDFALGDLGWRLGAPDREREPGSWLLSNTFEPTRVPLDETVGRPGARPRDIAFGHGRLEIDSLGTPEAPVGIDSRFELEFFAHDQREPEPNEGRSPRIRVRVVTPEELLRRLQDRLATTRIDALRLSEEQRAKRKRIEELIDALDGDAPLETGDSLAVSSALAGERRVQADAQALARALATAAEDVLYARLDEKAGALLEFYDARAAEAREARFQAAPWRALARENAAGKLSGEGFASTLVQLVALALEISEDHAGAAVAALDAAENATARPTVANQLELALEHAGRVEQRLEVLLAELAEWDNFQSVLTLARDILNRQKALRDRTQQFATEK